MKTTANCNVMFMLVISLIVLCGCGTFPMKREVNSPGIESAVLKAYSGTSLSADKLARIITTSKGGVNVSKIDGRSVSLPPWPISMDGWEETIFEVLPGTHEMDLESPREFAGSYGNMRQYAYSKKSLSVTVKAGCSYTLTSETNALFWNPVLMTSGSMAVKSGGGRADFEKAIQEKMRTGELHSESLQITYPDGTTREFKSKQGGDNTVDHKEQDLIYK